MRLVNRYLLVCTLIQSHAHGQNAPQEVVGKETDTPASTEQVTNPAANTPQPNVLTDAAQSDGVATHRVKLVFKEKGTGSLLKRVEVSAGSVKLYSDPKGEIFITVTKDSDGSISVSKKGFETRNITATTLLANETLDIFLFPKLSGDDVVLVKGERRTSISKKKISIAEASKIAPNNDPGQIIKIMPGVQTANFGSQVVIRGSGPNDSRYYIDDLDVPFLYHAIGQLTVIPPGIISEVEFDSGGFSAQYGNASGGVIRLETTTEIPKRPKTEITSNVPVYSGVYHERPLSKDSSLSFGVRRSYLDFFIQKILDSMAEENGSDTPVISPVFADTHVRYVKKTTGGHKKYSMIASQDGLEAIFPSDSSSNETGTAAFSINNYFVIFGAEIQSKINQEWRYKTTPQTRYNVIDSNFAGNLLEIRSCVARAPTEFTKRISKDEDMYLGFDPEYYRTRVDIFSIIPDFSDPTFDFEEAEKVRVEQQVFFNRLALWAERDKMIGKKLKLTAGVRGYWNSQTQKTTFDPRLRAFYKADKTHSFKAAYGRYSQHPLPQESGDNAGNPDLLYEASLHQVLGVQSKWTDEWTTELQLFHKSIDHVINQAPAVYYDNNGTQESYGAEIFVRRNLTSRLFGWLAYTYSQNREKNEEDPVWRPTQYDQTHVVNFATSYRLTSIWELGLRYKYNTGDTETPYYRAIYNGNLDKYQPRVRDQDTNADRLPDVNTASLYATRDFLYDTWKLKFKFGLESFWFKDQVVNYSYNFDYTKRYPQAAPTAIPFIEVTGVL